QESYRGYVPDDYLDNIPLNDEIVARTAKYLETAECHLAVHQKQIMAFAYVTYPEDDTFEVNALYVPPQYQNCGAGALLVNELCKEKKKAGSTKCVVWTMKFGPSLSFYQKLNFEQTTEEKTWKFDIPIIKLIRQL
ncbi:MAG: GNAT family N-acetyltransferase, partial [Alphaproteobacteria bacterium]|nr:GNAT family N-acetyltransferase [Alphaproteobacteria bacterium]